MKLAVLGASGFIGSRAVEWFHLGGLAEVRPIVRGYPRLARSARFRLDWRVADARDQAAVFEAVKGCDAVIHTVVGDASVILDTIRPVYRAAQRAGVKRLIYLSTASVHGQTPAPGTTEGTSLHERHELAYNNAKVRAEKWLLAERRHGDTEVVLLRPGIVYGPRSRWILEAADQLTTGTLAVVNSGRGICQSLYVDNLIFAVERALQVSEADGQTFCLADRELVAWADFYRPLAEALQVDWGNIPEAPVPPPPPGRKFSWKKLHGTRAVQGLLPLIPGRYKRAVKAALGAWSAQPEPSPWRLKEPGSPAITREMALLYQCAYRLPITQAERVLGYQPPVSFAVGMRRSIAWLAFAGYPVKGPGDAP